MNQPSSSAFVFASWSVLIAGILTYLIGLWNGDMMLSEKGFYGMAFTLSLYAAIVVQKNTRDSQAFEQQSSALSNPDES